jgi:polar amino acid transport system substrate-binding protein
MKLSWTLALAAAFFLSLQAGPAQAAGELDAVKAAGRLRVAVFSDKPPFGFVDANGQYQGYDVYLARRLAQNLFGDQSKIEFVPVEASNRIQILQSDKADVVLANFTLTVERAEQVDFAKPYMKVALGVSSPAGSPVTDVSQLAGKKLIVNTGTTADFYFSRNHPEVELLKYDHNTEAFNALRDGLGAGLAHDNTMLFAWVRENPGFVTGIDFLGDLDVIAPAVKKGNAELLQWLDEEIAKLAAEGFFQENYAATLRPAYGDSVDPDSVLIKE